LENWFDPNREIVILSEDDDPIDIYSQLLADPERILQMGDAARKRVLKDHTYKQRAIEIVKAISETKVG
jgi:spore maturation protein CgeB